jgi:hypothetical protein
MAEQGQALRRGVAEDGREQQGGRVDRAAGHMQRHDVEHGRGGVEHASTPCTHHGRRHGSRMAASSVGRRGVASNISSASSNTLATP